MLLSEYKEALEDMDGVKITNTRIAKVLNTTPQNISKRIKNNSELTVSELSTLEAAFGLFVLEPSAVGLSHSLKVRKANFKQEFTTWGTRLEKIAAENELKTEEMAKILDITEDEYYKILCNDEFKFSVQFIENIVENFDVDLNWLFLAKHSMVSQKNTDIINSLPPDKFDKLLKLLND